MTRKKFVKQLMAMGYDRNSADFAASFCVNRGASYEQGLEWAKIGYRSRSYLDELVANLAKAVQPAVEAAAEIVRKFTEAVSAIDWAAVGELVADLAATADRETAVHRADALDALSYSALIAGRGNGRSDMVLTEQHFKKITDVSLVPSGGYPLGGGGNE